MGASGEERPLVITDEDLPDVIAIFLQERGHRVELTRTLFGTGTPDHVVAQGASDQRAIVYTFNVRHFLALARKQRKDGKLRYPGMTLIALDVPRPSALSRLQAILEDIEAIYRLRVTQRGGRMIAVVRAAALRFDDPESSRPQRKHRPSQ